jgi:hypothetical protein
MKTILVIANETIGGAALFDAVKARVEAAGGDARVVACVPRGTPKHGNVIYDEAVHQAAQVRIDLARQVMREAGIDAIGEVGDRDPYTAAMDAVREYHPDEIIISTYPATSSGWLRRDLVERIEGDAGVPVEHVVVDLDSEGLPYDVTLVLANRTAASDDLLSCLKEKATGDRQRLFICVVPQEGGDGLARSRTPASSSASTTSSSRRCPRRARAGCGPTSSTACGARPAGRSRTSRSPRPPPTSRRRPEPWRQPPFPATATAITTARRRRTAAPGSTPRRSGCCCSSSARSWSSGPSSRPTSSSGS